MGTRSEGCDCAKDSIPIKRLKKSMNINLIDVFIFRWFLDTYSILYGQDSCHPEATSALLNVFMLHYVKNSRCKSGTCDFATTGHIYATPLNAFAAFDAELCVKFNHHENNYKKNAFAGAVIPGFPVSPG
jgi:hypothetical protein